MGSILIPNSSAQITAEPFCVEVDTDIVFTTGGYHMSRAKPGRDDISFCLSLHYTGRQW